MEPDISQKSPLFMHKRGKFPFLACRGVLGKYQTPRRGGFGGWEGVRAGCEGEKPLQAARGSALAAAGHGAMRGWG